MNKKLYKEVKGKKKYRFNFQSGAFVDIIDYNIISAQLRLSKVYPNFQLNLKNVELIIGG